VQTPLSFWFVLCTITAIRFLLTAWFLRISSIFNLNMSPSHRPNLPPLSNSQPAKFRRSKSHLYHNKSPEWFWKLSPTLPQLWIRDANLLTPEILAELEAAWLKYQTLNIPGSGDGGDIKCRARRWRRKLEDEYGKLDEETKRAKEVALARYEDFAIRGGDGSLDYHTEVVERSGRERRCTLM
jgi:hypothetical protein